MAFLALGSNLGDRERHLRAAREALAGLADVRVAAETPVEETAPLGGLDQPAYLNQMVSVATSLSASALLAACREIEAGAGRQRGERWSSRTLDIDLVRYGDLQCDLPGLVLPHPGLRDRTFWATELAFLEQHG